MNKLNRFFRSYDIFVFSILLTCVFSLREILSGSIAFWFDPARDLLSALNNLHKITLIGPPSGIPCIFYGPYWIWLLSISLIFSKDPRIISIIIEFLPYFLIFPILLYKLFKGDAIILWLLFFLSFGYYTSNIWNPYLAPLFIFVSYYLLLTNFYQSKRDMYKIFLAGIVSGLALNFHISFTTGFIIGVYIFLFATIVSLYKKNRITTIIG